MTDERMVDGEIIDLALRSLVKGPKVRAEQIDINHATTLVPFLDVVPPIVVRRKDDRSYQVVDGQHRWSAAKLAQRETIRAVIVKLDEAEALEAAVRANISHGLPLSTAERKSVARELIRTTDWADRRIAEACGLHHETVSGLRPPATRPTGDSDQLDTRQGSDGRRRPASRRAADAGRQKVAELARANPDRSARSIADEAGVSPTTASDVKGKVERGEDPVPFRPQLVRDEPDTDTRVDEVVTVWPAHKQWAKDEAFNVSNESRDFARFMDANLPDLKVEVEVMARNCPAPQIAGALLAAEHAAAFWNQLNRALKRGPISIAEDA